MNSRSILFSFLMIGGLFTSSAAVAVDQKKVVWIAGTRIIFGAFCGAFTWISPIPGGIVVAGGVVRDQLVGLVLGGMWGALFASCEIVELKINELQVERKQKIVNKKNATVPRVGFGLVGTFLAATQELR